MVKKSRRTEKRVSNMSDEELRKQGFKPGETLKDKQEQDERENPSRR